MAGQEGALFLFAFKKPGGVPASLGRGSGQYLLFAITQGGFFKDLR